MYFVKAVESQGEENKDESISLESQGNKCKDEVLPLESQGGKNKDEVDDKHPFTDVSEYSFLVIEGSGQTGNRYIIFLTVFQ